MQSVRFVRNNPAEGEIYRDPQTRESYVLKNGYVHNVNVYRKPGQAPVIEVRHTLFPHVRLEVESDARALRHFGVDHPGLHKSNPSEYWKKNVQKALKAYAARRAHLLGDIDSAREDRDLSGLDLSGANLRGDNLHFANLSKANLAGAKLTGADLEDSNLTGANLSGALLTGANLTRANLIGADLSHAWLTSANLRDADLTNADLTGANLTFANLKRANLTGATMPDGKLNK